MEKNFNPGKYGMVICPFCDGEGFFFRYTDGMPFPFKRVCAQCGGFGAIREEKEMFGSLREEVQLIERDGLEQKR